MGMMAEDNIAIRISEYDPPVMPVYNSTTEDVEFGYDESASLLRSDLPKSLKESLSSSIETSKTIFSYLWSAIKWFFDKTKIFWGVVVYSIFGAMLFIWLEASTDIESKLEKRQYHLIARDVLLHNIRLLHNENRGDMEHQWKEAIIQYEENMGIEMPEGETSWTFWMSLLYAGTIYTTIGYGNIACSTTAGRVASILYGCVGIPMMIIVLDQLGQFLTEMVKWINSVFEDLILFLGVKSRLMRIKSEKSLKRYIEMSKKFAFVGFSGSIPSKEALNIVEKKPHSEKSETVVEMPPDEDEIRTASETPSEEERRDPPVLAAITFTFLWIVASSAVFCLWEDWSYGTSVYFFIISTSTIGFGDVTPDHPEYMAAAFGVVIVGLSLVSVCINVINEWIYNWYMGLLQRMIDEYIESQANGDESAAKDFMTGFNSRAKFLMPLVKKSTGVKVMDKIKQDAKARNIELPAALTDLNPKTGKPNFLGASNAQIDQIIEKAQSEGKLTPTILMPPSSAIPFQATSVFGDQETAQTQTDISWAFFESRISESCQADLPLTKAAGNDVAVDVKPKMRNTGIQPEVSFILQLEPSRIEKMELETVILANREAIEGEEMPEGGMADADEIGFLRFLKSTGTQVEVEIQESGFQTEEKVTVSSEVQVDPELGYAEIQTDQIERRDTRTQTKLTTMVQTPEELERERERLKEERKAEFLRQTEERSKVDEGLGLGKRRIILDPEEKRILKEKLIEIRIEEARDHRLKGTPLVFDIKAEKNVLIEDLKKLRKGKKGKPQERKHRRKTDASASSLEDDVFLVDESDLEMIQKEIGSDGSGSPTPPLPTFAVHPPGRHLPQHLQQQPQHQQHIPQADAFAQLLAAALLRASTTTTSTSDTTFSTSTEPSPSSVLEREDGSRIEVIEGVVTYYNSEGQPILRQEGFLGEPEKLLNEVAKIQRMIQAKEIPAAESSAEAAAASEEGKTFQEQLQAILVKIGAKEERIIVAGEPAPVGRIIAADEPIILTPQEILGIEAPPTILTLPEVSGVPLPQQHRLRAPFESLSRDAILIPPTIEISQNATPEFSPEENVVEITLDVEMIRRNRSEMSSLSAAGANYASISSAEELHIEELEDLIDYDDLFNELELGSEQDEIELFMDSIGIQTELSFFDRRSEGMVTDPEKFTFGVQTDLTALDEEKGPQTLAEALLPKQVTSSAQTSPLVLSEAVQTDAERHDKAVGGIVDYESTEMQTIEKEFKDAFSEPDEEIPILSTAVQADFNVGIVREAVQVRIPSVSQASDAIVMEVERKPLLSQSSVQTDEKSFTDSESQAVIDTSDSSTETESIQEKKTTAEVIIQIQKDTSDNESQTETSHHHRAAEVDIQISKDTSDNVSQTETSHRHKAAEVDIQIPKDISDNVSQTEKSYQNSSAEVDIQIPKDTLDNVSQTDLISESQQKKAVDAEIQKETSDNVAQTEITPQSQVTRAAEVEISVEKIDNVSQTDIISETPVKKEVEALIQKETIDSVSQTDEISEAQQKASAEVDIQLPRITIDNTSQTIISGEAHQQQFAEVNILKETIDNIAQTDLSSSISNQAMSTTDELMNESATAVQPLTSSFYPRSDSPIDDEYESINYMVDKSTERDYELVMEDATTQYRIARRDYGQQHAPEVEDSASQYDEDLQQDEKVVQTGPHPRIRSPPTSYSSTSVQTENESPPIIIDASVSLPSPYESSPPESSSSPKSEEEYYEDETTPESSETASVATEAPPSRIPTFFVESITYSADIGTQVNFINIDVQTQIEKGDFNKDIETQAAIAIIDRQTSLHSEDLEPLESGFSYGGDLSYLWSDFDFVGDDGGDDDEEEYTEDQESLQQEGIAGEEETEVLPSELAAEVPGQSLLRQSSQDHPPPSLPTESSFFLSEEKRARSASPGSSSSSKRMSEKEAETLRARTEINLSDLDTSRRERMMDIGIQTGVLARVQHIYGKGKSSATSKEEQMSAPGVHRITLRKSKSGIPSPTSSTSDPAFPHFPPGSSRAPLIPPPKLIESAKNTALHGRHWEKQQSVSDLRTRLEKAKLQSSTGSLWGSKGEEGSTSSLQIFGTETAAAAKSPGPSSATASSTEIAKKEEEEEKEKKKEGEEEDPDKKKE